MSEFKKQMQQMKARMEIMEARFDSKLERMERVEEKVEKSSNGSRLREIEKISRENTTEELSNWKINFFAKKFLDAVKERKVL